VGDRRDVLHGAELLHLVLLLLADRAETEGRQPAKIRPEYWRYFWATNRCPIGKGPSYLDRIEAKNDAELATVQLKGLKLLMWAAVLSIFRVFYTKTLYGSAAESTSFAGGIRPV
jgi:hypothetical protein